MIEEALSELGYTSFDNVDSEAAAIDAASVRCPDLITADDRLAQGSGVAAVQTICADQRIPVVFITGGPLEINMLGAITLEKPFRMEELGQAVATARTALSSPATLH